MATHSICTSSKRDRDLDCNWRGMAGPRDGLKVMAIKKND